MSRQEFTNKVYVEIVLRATIKGHVFCEECHAATNGKFHVDHIIADGLRIDKSKQLTAKDGQVLCLPCHGEKTPKDVRMISKAKRLEARHLGKKTKTTMQSAGFAPAAPKIHDDRPGEKISKRPLSELGPPAIMRQFKEEK